MTEDIAVLLPLQLETVFRPNGEAHGSWELLLRVIPQASSVDNHSTHVTEHERDAVSAFRQALGSADPLTDDWFGTDAHREAFAELARTVGPARAAWLAEHVPAELDGDAIRAVPVAVDDAPPAVRGLPARLQVGVWTYADGEEQPQVIGSLPEEGRPPISPSLELPTLTDAASVLDHWVSDWEAAREAGLGGVFALPDGLGPLDLGGVCVWGVGDEPPGPLFGAHSDAGVLAELPLGAATTSVDGAPTAVSSTTSSGAAVPDGAPTEEDWWRTLLRRLRPGAGNSLDRLVERYVAGADVPSLARPFGRQAVLAESFPPKGLLGRYAGEGEREHVDAARANRPSETGLASLMHHALFPVLWGSSALEEWGLSPDDAGGLGRWLLENVHPEGPLPSIRIGDEPYGVLPVTRLDSWSPAPDDPPGVDRVVAGARALRSRLHRALAETGTVRGADRARYAHLLGRGGSSRRFGTRLSARLGLSSMTPAASLWDAGRDRRYALVDVLGGVDPVADPERDAFVETALGADAVGLPLVQASLATVWGDEEAFVRVPLPALLDAIVGDEPVLRLAGLGSQPASVVELFGLDDHLQQYQYEGEAPEIGWRKWPLGVLPGSLLARLLVQSALAMNRWRAEDREPRVGPGLDRDGWRLSAMQLAALLEPPGDPDGQPLPWLDTRDWLVARHGDPGLAWLPTPRQVPALPAPVIEASRLARLERALGATLDTFSTRLDPWVTAVAWKRLGVVTETQPRHRLGAYGWVHGPFAGTPGPTGSGLLHTPSQGQTLVATLARDNYRQNLRSGIVNEQGEAPWGIALTGTATRIAEDLVADLRDGHHLYEIVGGEVERIVASPAPSPYEAAATLRVAFPMYADRPDPRQVCQGIAALDAYLGGAPVPVPVSEGQLASLRELRAGVDAIADIALLDGALSSASRRPARAAASMRGVSGSGALPEPEYPRTPVAGREVSTTVLSVVPWREAGPVDEAGALAEPSVAALLEDRFGTHWVWRVDLEDGTTATVTLDALGLRPIDTLALAPAQLRRVAAVACGVVGGPTGRTSELGAAGPGEVFEPAISEHENRAWAVLVDGEQVGEVTLARVGLTPDTASRIPEKALHRRALRVHFAPRPTPAGATLQPVPSDARQLWVVENPLGRPLGVFDAHALGLQLGVDHPLDAVAPAIRALAGAPSAVVVDPPEPAAAARLCALLGAPATGQELRPGGASPDVAVTDALAARHALVGQHLDDTIDRLLAAAGPGVTRAQRIDAVRRGARWGVTPDTTPADAAAFAAALAGLPRPPGATRLRPLLLAMVEVLRGRAAVVEPEGGADSWARALSALVSPQGNLPILGDWSTADLAAVAPLSPGDPATLGDAWLTVVAPVRPALARVEAFQLRAEAEDGHALAAWVSSPDPWLKAEIEALAAAERGLGGVAPSFTCAFGPPGALDGERVAVGVVDSYTELVPLRARDTHAAFGFNAPLARAPQAILLAVAPNEGDPLTDDDVAVMLRELRELVAARAATPADLVEDGLALRTTWIPEDAPVGILEPAHRYVNL